MHFFLISLENKREASSFQYKFTVPLRELCMNSKRCMYLLKSAEDVEYINLLKLPLFVVSEPGNLDKSVNKILGNVHTPHRLNDSTNHLNFNTSIMSPSTSILASSILKRKASTPHPTAKSPTNRKSVLVNANLYENDEANVSASPRTLASSLKYARATITNSGSKSVKFKLTKYTREITDENQVVDDEVEEADIEENNLSPVKLIETTNNVVNEASVSSQTSKQLSDKHSPERKKLTFAENDENEPLVFKNQNKSVEERHDYDDDDGDVSMQFEL
jgi:hypothetical protein